jgi:hypothetical protein
MEGALAAAAKRPKGGAADRPSGTGRLQSTADLLAQAAALAGRRDKADHDEVDPQLEDDV